MVKAYVVCAVALIVFLGSCAILAQAEQAAVPKEAKATVESTAARTTAAASEETPPRGKLKWRVDMGQEGESTPVVEDGTLYQGLKRSLVALDAATGRKKWVFHTGAGVCGTPVVAEGKVFFSINDYGPTGGSRPQIFAYYALDAATGKQLWMRNSDIEPPTGGMAVVDAVVYVAGGLWGNGAINALDAQTGGDVWEFRLDDYPSIRLTVADGAVYFGDYSKVLYALDAKTGLKKWSRLGLGCAPAVLGDTLFAARRNELCAAGTDNGRAKWTFPTGSPVTTIPTVSDGALYFANKKGTLFAISAADGKEKWHCEIGPEAGEAVVAGDGVYCNTNAHFTAYALDIETGRKKWFFNTGDYMPHGVAVANGVVYFTSGKYLYAVEAK